MTLAIRLLVPLAHRIRRVEASVIQWRRFRRSKPMVDRVTGHLFELAVAISWMLVGMSFIPNPTDTAAHSPVGRNLGVFAVVWSIMFIAGGLLVVWGVLRSVLGVRVGGLLLLATGLMMEGIGALTFEPSPRVLVYFVYCLACLARGIGLTMEQRRGT